VRHRIWRLYTGRRLRPVIDRVLPLDRIADAHRALEDRQAFGKVVLEIGGGRP
jgi:NADPH:quinone reductase-like Zn-dependent oxidoreductase